MTKPPRMLASAHIESLAPFLPPHPAPALLRNDINDGKAKNNEDTNNTIPSIFLTLTFAISLDGQLSGAVNRQTMLSGSETKSMTNYLRIRHDSILVGVGTVLADDPGLMSSFGIDVTTAEIWNSIDLDSPSALAKQSNFDNTTFHRSSISNVSQSHPSQVVLAPLPFQPRPIILDPKARWNPLGDSTTPQILQLADQNLGLAPWVLVSNHTTISPEYILALHSRGGQYIHIPTTTEGRFSWTTILSALSSRGLRSVMVEGGAVVLEPLLAPGREEGVNVNAVIVTVAPVWVGREGAGITLKRQQEHRHQDATQSLTRPVLPISIIKHAQWLGGMGKDVVLCGTGLLNGERTE